MTSSTRVFATFTGNHNNVLMINPKDVSAIKQIKNHDNIYYILILSCGETMTLSPNHDLENIFQLLDIKSK